nr:hypothetical protein [Candidatus Sigynarchaeota archaeon]
MNSASVKIIPVYHGRVNFAKLVSTTFQEFNPDRVAVELPIDLKETVLKAVNRLPVLSIVGYVENEQALDEILRRSDDQNPENKSEPGKDQSNTIPAAALSSRYTFIPVHPADPIIEGIRLALEGNKEIDFIDLVLDNYNPIEYELPDDETLEYIDDFSKLQELIMDYLPRSDRGSVDYDRELCMASRLHDLAESGQKILFITGFAHANRIKEFLETNTRVDVVDPYAHKYQQIFNVAPISSDLIIDEIPYIEYLYELTRILRLKKETRQAVIDNVASAKFDFFKESEKYLEQEKKDQDRDQDADEEEEDAKSQSTIDDRWIQVLKRVTSIEAEFLDNKTFSKKDALTMLFEVSSTVYQDYYFRDPVSAFKSKSMMQYLRNWAIIRERLFPSLDQVVMTAKNFVNDEYASVLLDFARMYPFIDMAGMYPAVYHDVNNQVLGPGNILFKSRESSKHRSWIQLPIKRRPMERSPGQWQRAWDDDSLGMCSFPPEDKIEEDFFNQMRVKTISMLEEKHVKIHEFKDSLMDGVEFRETMRKRILGKLYVKEIIPVIGKAGSVVIVFDPDEKRRYGNQITWWAEHDQESDMAFYATFPEENLIGPGIARIELGGLVSIFPPKHIPEIWHYFFQEKSSFKRSEILLLAAIHFSDEKFIPYVANDPPSKRIEGIANDFNKMIVHIPLWKMSGETLDRVRYIHVLMSKNVRSYAKDYIFL